MVPRHHLCVNETCLKRWCMSDKLSNSESLIPLIQKFWEFLVSNYSYSENEFYIYQEEGVRRRLEAIKKMKKLEDIIAKSDPVEKLEESVELLKIYLFYYLNKEGISLCNKILEISSKQSIEIKNSDFYAELARVNSEYRNFKEAQEYSEKAISLDPNNLSGYCQKARAMYRVGSTKAEAIECIQKNVLDVDPEFNDGLLECMSISRQMNDEEFAVKKKNISEKNFPFHPRLLFEMGRGQDMIEKYIEGSKYYVFSMLLAPNDYMLYLNTSHCLIRVSIFNWCAKICNIGILLDESKTGLYHNMGLSYHYDRKNDLAIESFKNCIKSIEDDPNQPNFEELISREYSTLRSVYKDDGDINKLRVLDQLLVDKYPTENNYFRFGISCLSEIFDGELYVMILGVDNSENFEFFKFLENRCTGLNSIFKGFLMRKRNKKFRNFNIDTLSIDEKSENYCFKDLDGRNRAFKMTLESIGSILNIFSISNIPKEFEEYQKENMLTPEMYFSLGSYYFMKQEYSKCLEMWMKSEPCEYSRERLRFVYENCLDDIKTFRIVFHDSGITLTSLHCVMYSS